MFPPQILEASNDIHPYLGGTFNLGVKEGI
jgi:hypothetical protein